MIITRHKQITTNGVVSLWGTSFVLKQFVIVVSDAGTSWKIKVQDVDSSPAIIIPPITLTAPSTLAWIVQYFKEGLPMLNGLNFVTISGTPGVLDIWTSMEQPTP